MNDIDTWVSGSSDTRTQRRLEDELATTPEAVADLVKTALFEADLVAAHKRPSARHYVSQVRPRPARRRRRRQPMHWTLPVAAACLLGLTIGLWMAVSPASPASPASAPGDEVGPTPTDIAGPRPITVGSSAQTVTWQQGVELDLGRGSRVRPTSAGWPYVEAGSVTMRVTPGRVGPIGLVDSRLRGEVFGTEFTLVGGEQASVLRVHHGTVRTSAGGQVIERTANQWVWMSEHSVVPLVGSGPAPPVALVPLTAWRVVGDAANLTETAQGWQIRCHSHAVERAPYAKYSGIEAAVADGASWWWHGRLTVPTDRTQAAIRLFGEDGQIYGRITFRSNLIAIGEDWPTYQTHAALSSQEHHSEVALHIRCVNNHMTVWRDGEIVIETAIPASWAQATRLQMVAQGHVDDTAEQRLVHWSDIFLNSGSATP